MTIYNLGSINLDYFYHVPHMPQAGETLAAMSFFQSLGGKGANQSVAIARAGGKVVHIGKIHQKDESFVNIMATSGVDLANVVRADEPTGHAVITIEQETGENQILLMAGANHQITSDMISQALATAQTGDWALTQNETNLTEEFLRHAKKAGLKICYSAAPFDKKKLLAVWDLIDLLIVNEIEANEIQNALKEPPVMWQLPHLIITKGSAGADYYGQKEKFHQPAIKVKALDSTGAGDTYLGYVLASLSQGKPMREAMALASKAASLQVARYGTADAIPTLAELR